MRNNVSSSCVLVLLALMLCVVSVGAVSAVDVDNSTNGTVDDLNGSDNGTNGSVLVDSANPKFNGDLNNTGQSDYVGPVSNYTNWTQSLSGSVCGSVSIGADGTLYVGTYISEIKDGYLYALNPNGTVKWRYHTGGIDGTPAIGVDGTIYIGSWTGFFYAFNPDGTLKWKYELGDSSSSYLHYIRGSPSIGADGTIYVGSCNFNSLIAFNPDGTVKWMIHNGSVSASPAIGVDGTIYIGVRSHALLAVNPDGTVKWTFSTYNMSIYSSLEFSSPVIGPDGTIYVGDNSNYLYALNPDGTLKWSYLSGGDIEGICLSSDGMIYFGTSGDDCAFYALNPDGSLKWKYKNVHGHVFNCVVGADGTIYFGTYDINSHVTAFNPDGSLKWEYYTGLVGCGVIGAPVIGADGTLYAGDGSGTLYAFKDPSPVVANFTIKNTSNPLVVGFNDSSVNSPSSWLWDFGDGSTSSEKNPVHTYARSGTYLVSLTVGNVVGNSTKSFNVTVSDAVCPVVNISKHGGSFNTGQVVNLSVVDDSGNATVYYTLDGSDPRSSATRQVYTGGIMINSSTTLRFAGIDSSDNWGSIGSESYVIDKIAPKVVLSNPKVNAKSISRTSVLSVKLSENLKKSVNWSKIYVKNLKTGKLVKVTVSIVGNVLRITTSKRSSYTWYQLYIPASAVKDVFGNNLAKGYVVKFKTKK